MPKNVCHAQTNFQWIYKLKFFSTAIADFLKQLIILKSFNPLYTGELCHCYTLDESICHFRDSGLFCRFYSIFDGNSGQQTM